MTDPDPSKEELYERGWLKCNTCGQWWQEYDNVGDPCPADDEGILGRW